MMKLKHLIALFLHASFLAGVSGQTLREFGYQHFSPANGPTPRMPPNGSRSCLVILIDNANTGKFARSANWYQTNVFDPLLPHSVNGFFLENSCGRFLLKPAAGAGMNGVLGPLTLNPAEAANFASDAGAGLDGNVAMSAAVRAGFPLASYDLDTNGVVGWDELAVLVIYNQSRGGRGQTGSMNYQLPDGSARCYSLASSVPEDTVTSQFSTVTHEMCHNVGNMADLYYYTIYEGTNYTLNAGITQASDSGEIHLDPRHKLTFGWNEPRLVSMRQGGRFYVPAAQNGDPTAPLLLYDPLRGAAEYFLLEYRTKHRPGGPGFDSNLASEGLLIWHIRQDLKLELVTSASPFGLTGNNTRPFVAWVEGPSTETHPDRPTPGAAWPGGRSTPRLRWNDGSDTPVSVRARPFELTNPGIVVEVLAVDPSVVTWVDFSFPGRPIFDEDGSRDRPFNTLNEGIEAVAYGGHLRIFAGSSRETLVNLGKPMSIESFAGSVMIGR